jgi:hypothetical protein
MTLKRTVSKQNSASSWIANTNIEGETLKRTFKKISLIFFLILTFVSDKKYIFLMKSKVLM